MKLKMNPLSLTYLALLILVAINGNSAQSNFNDPKWPTQWYLKLMNIEKAWQNGYTGRGVLIGVVDSGGMAWNNPEFQGKYEAASSYDFIDNHTDPSPGSRNYPHGTKVAGLAAAKANNGFCGVGVAYDAKLAGFRFQFNLPGASMKNIADFSPAMTNVDIYACAWGPLPGFANTKVTYLVNKESDALKRMATQGRNGKGSLILFAAGNSGKFHNNCGYNGYVDSMYTMGISMVNRDNSISRLSEICTAIMATAYTRDGDRSFGTTSNPMAVPSVDGKCDDDFSSSSAATAVASGVFALLLQARLNLTWRAVQNIVAVSSDPSPLLRHSESWKRNGAGLLVSNRFGFGLLDADAMIKNAQLMTQSPQLKCESSFSNINRDIPGSFDADFTSSNCQIKFIEHVVLTVNLTFHARGHLEVDVISPQKTRAIVLRKRTFDTRASALVNYPVLSLHHWRENPTGIWKITFRNTDTRRSRNGTLYNWKLTLYGTASDPWNGQNLTKNISTTSTLNPGIVSSYSVSSVLQSSITTPMPSPSPVSSYSVSIVSQSTITTPMPNPGTVTPHSVSSVPLSTITPSLSTSTSLPVVSSSTTPAESTLRPPQCNKTEYGCCWDEITVKEDKAGSNCPQTPTRSLSLGAGIGIGAGIVIGAGIGIGIWWQKKKQGEQTTSNVSFHNEKDASHSRNSTET